MERVSFARTSVGEGSRPFGVVALLVGQVILGLTAVVGGIVFLVAPDGSIYGLSVEMLSGTPFSDYLVPGLLLFLVLGVYPLVVAYLTVVESEWAWPASVSVGVAALAWMGVQIALIGLVAELQTVYVLLGVVLLALPFARSVRSFLGGDRYLGA